MKLSDDAKGKLFSDNDGKPACKKGVSKRVSHMQYYSYVLHLLSSKEHLFSFGWLVQQYVVDAWDCVE